jgi:uncharacterized protein YegP (UPF0339 family)
MDNSNLFGGNTAVAAALAAYAKKPRFEIYEDTKEPKNKFRWHIKMSSDIVAASSQGYATRSGCLENAKSVLSHLQELSKDGKLV